MSRITVKTRSWDRFVTRDFAVAPDVLGRQVEFSLGISRVRVALPTERDIGNRSDELAKVTIGSWYDERDRKIPIEFLIHNVDVVVDPDKSVEVPSDVFNRPPNAFDIISSAEQASLNTLANKCGEIAASAFDHWVRVLRWKAMNGAICRPAVQGSRSGWATHLQDENGRNFWATSVMIVVRGTRPITTDVWSHIESALHGGDTPPVYIELLFDAEYHLSLGDLRRSVIDSAVACEATMRQNIATHLPATLTKTARAQIERANVRPAVLNMFSEILDGSNLAFFKALRPRLEALFSARNEVMHRGTKPDLTIEECAEYLQVTRTLVALT